MRFEKKQVPLERVPQRDAPLAVGNIGRNLCFREEELEPCLYSLLLGGVLLRSQNLGKIGSSGKDMLNRAVTQELCLGEAVFHHYGIGREVYGKDPFRIPPNRLGVGGAAEGGGGADAD